MANKLELVQFLYETEMAIGGHEHRPWREYVTQERLKGNKGVHGFNDARGNVTYWQPYGQMLFPGSKAREVLHPENHISLLQLNPYIFGISPDIEQGQLEVYMHILVVVEALGSGGSVAEKISRLIESTQRYGAHCIHSSQESAEEYPESAEIQRNHIYGYEQYTESVLKILRTTWQLIEAYAHAEISAGRD